MFASQVMCPDISEPRQTSKNWRAAKDMCFAQMSIIMLNIVKFSSVTRRKTYIPCHYFPSALSKPVLVGLSALADMKTSFGAGLNIAVIFEAEMSNICWFQLLKSEDLLLFFVISSEQWVGQKKQFEDGILDSSHFID